MAVVALTSTPIIAVGTRTVPFDWPLIPSGLDTEGTRFRLLAISKSQTNALSTDIETYNTKFRNNVAQQGHAAIRPYADGFKVFGSTTDTAAIDNTDTNHNSGNRGLPIYYLNGDKVVDNYDELYNEHGDSSDDGDRWKTTDGWDVEGNIVSSNTEIWTGTDRDGDQVRGRQIGFTSTTNRNEAVWVLGGKQLFTINLDVALSTTPSDGLAVQRTVATWRSARLFGLSEIFKVGPTPDPLSATISGPETHRGGNILVDVEFNHALDTADTTLQANLDFKEHSLNVENGTNIRVYPRGDRGTKWVVEITPADSYRDVVVTLNSGLACGQTGAICTTISTTVLTLDETPTHTVRRVPPAIDNLRITSVPNDGVAYRVGESITATVLFDTPIAVVADEAPVLMLEFPSAIKSLRCTQAPAPAATLTGSGDWILNTRLKWPTGTPAWASLRTP